MNEQLKENIEKILMSILYEKKTAELIDDTLDKIKGVLGSDFKVGYQRSSENKINFMFAKLSESGEYRVWTVEVGPAMWTGGSEVVEDEHV